MTTFFCKCGYKIEFYTLYKGIEHKIQCSSCGIIHRYRFKKVIQT